MVKKFTNYESLSSIALLFEKTSVFSFEAVHVLNTWLYLCLVYVNIFLFITLLLVSACHLLV